MLLTYSVGKESSASRQAVTAEQKESVWFPIQEDSLRLFTEFFQKASIVYFREEFLSVALLATQPSKQEQLQDQALQSYILVADSALKNHEDFCIAMKHATLQARIKNWALLVRAKVDISTAVVNSCRLAVTCSSSQCVRHRAAAAETLLILTLLDVPRQWSFLAHELP